MHRIYLGKGVVRVLIMGLFATLISTGGAGPANATSTRAVMGNGTGTAFCSGRAFPATISFTATFGAGMTAGTDSVIINPGSPSAQDGIINKGHINLHNYKLDGVNPIDSCTPFRNAPISITGPCGAGVTITYTRLDFETSTFTGDVTCS